MRNAHVVHYIAGRRHLIQQIVLDGLANEYTLSGKQSIAFFRIAGTGCPRCREPILANFARVIANFAKKTTKSSQKSKEYVAISPTSQSEKELGESLLNS